MRTNHNSCACENGIKTHLPVKILSSNILEHEKKKEAVSLWVQSVSANTVHVEEHIINSSLNNRSQSNNQVIEPLQSYHRIPAAKNNRVDVNCTSGLLPRLLARASAPSATQTFLSCCDHNESLRTTVSHSCSFSSISESFRGEDWIPDTSSWSPRPQFTATFIYNYFTERLIKARWPNFYIEVIAAVYSCDTTFIAAENNGLKFGLRKEKRVNTFNTTHL